MHYFHRRICHTHTNFAVNVKKKIPSHWNSREMNRKYEHRSTESFSSFKNRCEILWNVMQESLSQTCPTLLVFSGHCDSWSSLSSVQYLRVFPGETSGHKAMFILPLLMFACMQIRWEQTHENTEISLRFFLGSNDLSCCPHTLAVYQLCLFLIIRNHYKISLLDSNILATNHRSQYSENVQIWLYLHIWYSVDCSWLSVSPHVDWALLLRCHV